jgi:hypothetical protein
VAVTVLWPRDSRGPLDGDTASPPPAARRQVSAEADCALMSNVMVRVMPTETGQPGMAVMRVSCTHSPAVGDVGISTTMRQVSGGVAWVPQEVGPAEGDGDGVALGEGVGEGTGDGDGEGLGLGLGLGAGEAGFPTTTITVEVAVELPPSAVSV